MISWWLKGKLGISKTNDHNKRLHEGKLPMIYKKKDQSDAKFIEVQLSYENKNFLGLK